jgi:preprotein translocase subunit SecA
VLEELVARYAPLQSVEDQWDVKGLSEQLQRDFAIALDIGFWLKTQKAPGPEDIAEFVVQEVDKAYQAKVESYGEPLMRHMEKALMMQSLDTHWREHLAAMDYLRQGIHLRSYAQKNPKQ